MTTTQRSGQGSTGDASPGDADHVRTPGPPTAVAIPADAVAFYAELEDHNDRDWWAANKPRYLTSVREPITALVEALAGEFGTPRIFRPQRDTRFSHDKSPYKTRQDALLQTGDVLGGGVGYFLRIGADGLVTGGGYHHTAADQVARFRAAVDSELTGPALVELVDALRHKGFEVHGDTVRTRPRGVPANHPRLELMRHQSLIVTEHHGTPDWLSSPAVVDHVRASFERVRPLCDWLADHVGPTQEEQTGRGWRRS